MISVLLLNLVLLNILCVLCALCGSTYWFPVNGYLLKEPKRD